ncbi:N-acetyltransferase [Phytobacter sp. V91]|uniref:N-acetyltransferase n=1 Tax=Phytobacter sp. V91 TaxID=3369425 RepID=UPI003F5E18C6
MIHIWKNKDISPLLTLWLESTTFAHPFITEKYWRDSEKLVREVYLPAAQTWVWEAQGKPQGFISVMETQFVGALFVRPAAVRRGIGKALLDHVKQRFSALSLEVYQNNERAVHFYHAQGFRIEDSAWQDDTRYPTWIMNWQVDQMPSA